MFDRHHGSIAERGTNPGNWEMAQPVETCRICSKVVLIRVCGCFAAVGFLRFMTAGIAAGGAVAGLLLPRGVVVSGGFHVRLLACVTVSQSGRHGGVPGRPAQVWTLRRPRNTPWAAARDASRDHIVQGLKSKAGEPLSNFYRIV